MPISDSETKHAWNESSNTKHVIGLNHHWRLIKVIRCEKNKWGNYEAFPSFRPNIEHVIDNPKAKTPLGFMHSTQFKPKKKRLLTNQLVFIEEKLNWLIKIYKFGLYETRCVRERMIEDLSKKKLWKKWRRPCNKYKQ